MRHDQGKRLLFIEKCQHYPKGYTATFHPFIFDLAVITLCIMRG
jgi:hypothetical protein